MSDTIDHDLHRRRREYLSPFFSQKNVLALDSLIVLKVGQLGEWFRRAAEEGGGGGGGMFTTRESGCILGEVG